MKIKTIGKIQFILGCFLLISILFSSIFITERVYLDNLEDDSKAIMDEWKNVIEKSNETNINVAGHVVSNIFILTSIYRTTGFVFVACMFVGGILSIILILEGLVNIKIHK